MKDLRKKAIYLLFFALLGLCKAEAEAEAEAQADPQAEPQYGPPVVSRPPYNPGSYPPYGPSNNGLSRPDYNIDSSPGFSRPDYNYNPDPGFSRPDFNYNPDPGFSRPDYNYNPDPGFNQPPPDTCGLTEECCGMENQNCCLKNEQKCYTVWDRKCDTETNLYCPVQVQQHCKNVVIPDCRIKPEVDYRTFTTSQCKPIPGKKCWNYQAKVCKTEMEDKEVDVDWQNQKLKLVSTDDKQKCVTVQTKECTNRTVVETITTQELKTQTYNETIPQCRMEGVQQPDRKVTMTVMQPVSRQMCYDMPVPTCTQTPCAMAGTCETGTTPCSNNNFNTATVCPQAPPGGNPAMPSVGMGGCQQVQQPVCNQGGGSACSANFQQCCRMSTRRVCRQVTQRVPKQVTQVIPGGFQYVQKCDNVVVPRTRQWYVPVTKPVERVKYDCKPVNKQECFDYKIPKYEVETEDVNDKVTIELPKCSESTETRQHCATIPDLTTECRTSTIQKALRINKIICDRRRTTQICQKIPVSVCQASSMPNCRMVPRQVCQNTCAQSSYCNTCNDFVQRGPGFGNCPTATCGQYYGMAGQNGTMLSGGGMYPYGDNLMATGVLVEDTPTIEDIFN